MANASTFPITTPYGWVKGYPLHTTPSDSLVPADQKSKYPGAGYGFHTGIDYGCPDNTPIVVNGVAIGLSNHTGAAIGPHLHLGKLVNGVITNPGTGGFNFTSAVVTQVAEDSTNGKFVRIRGDGADWIYDHQAKQLVTVGQVLKGGTSDMIPDENHLQALFRNFYGRTASADEVKRYVGTSYSNLIEILDSQQSKEHVDHQKIIDTGKKATEDNWPGQIYGLEAKVEDLEKQLQSDGTELKSGKYIVK